MVCHPRHHTRKGRKRLQRLTRSVVRQLFVNYSKRKSKDEIPTWYTEFEGIEGMPRSRALHSIRVSHVYRLA